MTRLGDVLLDVKPGFATGDDLEEGVFQFRMHNLTRDSALDLTKRRRVNATVKQLEKQSVAPGDVLFNATNSPELVGKSALISELDEPAVFSNHFMRLRTDRTQLDPGYLAYFLKFEFVRGVFRSMAKAWVNQATIGRDRLESLEIPLPPLPDQRRIAAILDHADALRAKRRQVLASLDALGGATFIEIFGPPEEWPRKWPMGTIGELATSVAYGTSSKAGSTGAWPILRMGNVTDDGRLDLSDLKYIDLAPVDVEKYTVRPGDMLFNRTNSREKVGKAAVVRTERPLAVAGYLVRVRFDDAATAEFVSAYLTSGHGVAVRRTLAKAAVNQANINATQMRAISIANPPMSIRKKFADALSAIDVERSKVESAAARDDELFSSLQSRAFRGEL